MINKIITSTEVKINEKTTCILQFIENKDYYLFINDTETGKQEEQYLGGLNNISINDLENLPDNQLGVKGLNLILKTITTPESINRIKNELFKSLTNNFLNENKNTETLKQITNISNPLYLEFFQFGKYYQGYGKQLHEIKNKGVDDSPTEVIANLSINKLNIIYDKLNTDKPFFNIEYYDGLQEKLISKKKLSKKELINEFKDSCCFIDDTNNKVEKVVSNLIYHMKKQNLISVEYELMKEGFFLDIKEDGGIKLLENTLISSLDISNDDVAEALKLVNEFLESRPTAISENSEIFNFMLSSPFHYCIKQLSLANNNTKGHLAYGEPQTSKTTTALIFYWLYGDPTKYQTGVSSLSALENKLNYSTLPSIIDEAYTLLKKDDVVGLLKRGMYGIGLRSVADMNDYNKNTDSIAYSTPFCSFNEPLTLKDGLIRRFYCNYFDSTMIIDDTEADLFDTQYKPLSGKSEFKKLRALGVAFRDKIKPYLETNSSKLTNIRKLTIEILEQIAIECDVELNKEILTLHESSTDLHMNMAEVLKLGLNSSFRKNIKPNYSNKTYCTKDLIDGASMGVIDWLKYQPNNQSFVILIKKFIKHCRYLTNSTIDLNLIIEYLELENYREVLNNPSSIKVGGKKERYAIRIDKEVLTKNIFSIILEDTKRIDDSLDDY